MSDIPTVTYYAYSGTRYVGQFSGEDSAVLAFIASKGWSTGPKPLASDRDLWVSIVSDATAAQVAAEAAAETAVNSSADIVDAADKLASIEEGADVTDTANVTAAGAVMDSEVNNLSGIKTLTIPDSTTISTFGAALVDDADAATARTTLGLGTAATTASTAYATAAQGALADTAVQPNDDADTLGSGVATNGQVLTADGAGGAAWENVMGGILASIRDEKASNTSGGLGTTSYTKRDLNTVEYDPGSLITLSSSEFSCSQDAVITWSAPGYDVFHKTRLVRTSDSAVISIGTAEWSGATNIQTRSFGVAEIEAGVTYKIEHRTENALGNVLGRAVNYGDAEVYTVVHFWSK